MIIKMYKHDELIYEKANALIGEEGMLSLINANTVDVTAVMGLGDRTIYYFDDADARVEYWHLA